LYILNEQETEINRNLINLICHRKEKKLKGKDIVSAEKICLKLIGEILSNNTIDTISEKRNVDTFKTYKSHIIDEDIQLLRKAFVHCLDEEF